MRSMRSTDSPPTPIEPLSEEEARSLEREGSGAEFRYHYLNRKISTKARAERATSERERDASSPAPIDTDDAYETDNESQ